MLSTSPDLISLSLALSLYIYISHLGFPDSSNKHIQVPVIMSTRLNWVSETGALGCKLMTTPLYAIA